jgi:hypothetical protein
VDVRIHDTRDRPDPGRDLPGHIVVGRTVRAHDLDIDGCRQPEVEDLADDVGRLEEKGHARELGRELPADLLHIREGRPVTIRRERHEDFPIGRPNGGAVAVGEVHTPHRQPDVVEHQRDLLGRDDPSNAGFHRAEDLVRLLDAGAGWCADMETELPGIHLREEVLADRGRQHQGEPEEGAKGHQHRGAVREGPGQRVLLRQRPARHRELQDGDAGGAVADDQRGRHPRRERAEDGLGLRRHLGQGLLDVRARLDEDLDEADAVHGLRFHVLDVIDRAVNARSVTVMTLFSMSSGDIPVEDQTTVTMGMFTSGKMSVGIRRIATIPSTAMRSAITTNVYGRRSASLTIHMMSSPCLSVLRPDRVHCPSLHAPTVRRLLECGKCILYTRRCTE